MNQPWLTPIILLITFGLQLIVPMVIWGYRGCCKKQTKKKEEEPDLFDVAYDNAGLETIPEGSEEGTFSSFTQRTVTEIPQFKEGEEPKQAEKQTTVKVKADRQAEPKKNKFSIWELIRIFSLDLYISFWLWLVFVIGCESTQCYARGFALEFLRGLSLFMMFAIPLYICYESYHSRERMYIRNILKTDSIKFYIERMKKIDPLITLKATCGHWEERERTITITDTYGHVHTRTENYMAFIVTHKEEEEFEFDSCRDVSAEDAQNYKTLKATRLCLRKEVDFGDLYTKDLYNIKLQAMIDRNKDKDKNLNIKLITEIPGFKWRVTAFVDMHNKAWWMTETWFWIATVFFFSWPYRLIFRRWSAKSKYTLHKMVYVKPSHVATDAANHNETKGDEASVPAPTLQTSEPEYVRNPQEVQIQIQQSTV